MSLSLFGHLLMQWVDLRFVGQLGSASVGAVGVGNALFSWVMVPGLALAGSLEYWIGDAVGRRRPLRARSDLIVQLGISALYTAVMGIALSGFGGQIFQQIEMTAQVRSEATSYLNILAWSLFPVVASNGIRAYVGAYSSTISTWGSLFVGNAFNFIGNAQWVPLEGVAGSAKATLCARMAVLAMFVLEWAWVEYSRVPKRRRQFVFSIRRAREILKIALPSAGQVLLEVGAFSMLVLWCGRFGEASLAAHNGVLQLASMAFMVPLGFGSAAATLVSRAYAAGHVHHAKQLSKIAVLATFAWASGVVILMTGFGPFLFATYHFADPAVIEIGHKLLWLAALMHLSDALQACMTGVLRGWGNTVTGFWANAFGHWCVGVPLAIFISLRIGVEGVWIGLVGGLTVVSLILARKLWATLAAAAE